MEEGTETRSYGEISGWSPTSMERLIEAERYLLSNIVGLKEPGYFVNIDGWEKGKKLQIRTYRMNQSSPNTPLVLLHGLGCGAAVWCKNLDALARNRPVYFIDMPGFGRSTRPNFHKDPRLAEDQFVESIEGWRKEVGLDKFYILGHSLGAYLATSYAMKYPDRVLHLVLEDTWGYAKAPARSKNNSPSILLRRIVAALTYPLFFARFLGPFGPWYICNVLVPFDGIHPSSPGHLEELNGYFYHNNARNPTGEMAFYNLMKGAAYAKYPMVERMNDLRADVPITFIHGQNSWVSKSTSHKVKEDRAGSYVDVKIVEDAGHTVHSDQPTDFNELVSTLLDNLDCEIIPTTKSKL